LTSVTTELRDIYLEMAFARWSFSLSRWFPIQSGWSRRWQRRGDLAAKHYQTL